MADHLGDEDFAFGQFDPLEHVVCVIVPRIGGLVCTATCPL